MALELTPDFSLVQGGPLFRLYRNSRLTTDDLELAHRRMIAAALFAWLPLAILSLLQGGAFAGAIPIPFFYDIEAHARFLIALPVLIGAELVVHRRISPVLRRFVERGIVRMDDLRAFNAVIESTLRVRDSAMVEIGLVALAYTFGFWVWRTQIALSTITWYARPDAAGTHYTAAGYWYVFVSIPLFQFILLRWYMRIALWFRLLWRVSRLDLHLTAAHPDRVGGIGFISGGIYAFGPLLFAQGAMMSGLIANRVLYEGQALVSFKLDALGLVGFFVLVVLGPMTMFTPKLAHAKRQGAADYASLAGRLVAAFEEKWLTASVPEIHQLLAATDSSSVADFESNYAVVKEMRIVPFRLHDVAWLAGATAAPLVPLLLTAFSLEEVVTHVIKILF